MNSPIYISNGGDALGPYEMGQLRSMWNTGQLTANTLYWNADRSAWRTIAVALLLLIFFGRPCCAQQSGAEWMAERQRDWEVNTLRSEASSLDSQRRMGVEQEIGNLEWKRKSYNFSESDFMQRAQMDWDVRRLKDDIWRQQNEQRQDEQQRQAQEELNRQQIGAVSAHTLPVAEARTPKQRRQLGPLTASEKIRLSWGWGASELASPEEKERVAYHQQQEQALAPKEPKEEKFLDGVTAKMKHEADRLEVLIPQAEFASDLAQLYLLYPFGCGAEDIRQLWASRWEQLVKAGLISPPTKKLSMTELQEMLDRGDAQCAEIAREIDKAAAALGKTRKSLSQ